MANNAIETVMGAVVLAVAGGFLYFAYDNSNVKTISGYEVNASFTNIGGINVGSDVRIGGIKVGVVESLTLDPKSYNAQAVLRVKEDIALPKDTSASVQSAGLLGDKFIALQPGGDEKNLADGETIKYTESSVSLEEMIGKYVFSGGGADKDDGASDSSASDDNELSTGLE
jgi:phospholipid/cholesterol/gamma-HCH transport system substrate-binding protein